MTWCACIIAPLDLAVINPYIMLRRVLLQCWSQIRSLKVSASVGTNESRHEFSVGEEDSPSVEEAKIGKFETPNRTNCSPHIVNLYLYAADTIPMHFRAMLAKGKREGEERRRVLPESCSSGLDGSWRREWLVRRSYSTQTKPNEAPIHDDSRPRAPPRLHFYYS